MRTRSPPAAATVMVAESTSDPPAAFTPLACRLYCPAAVELGIVTLVLMAPVASAVTVPRRTDPLPDTRSMFTDEAGWKPQPLTVTEPPGGTVLLLVESEPLPGGYWLVVSVGGHWV